ncbi:MAG: hypothetical protein HQL46_12305 [Gammaproteobacteria bacterium]|nr:hypothetical protein [Gammaproteobacteria bacterium]
MKIKTIILSLCLSNYVGIGDVYAASDTETQIYHLLHPSFEELMSEFLVQKVTIYTNVQDSLIDQALDKYFDRIEYMTFSDGEE